MGLWHLYMRVPRRELSDQQGEGVTAGEMRKGWGGGTEWAVALVHERAEAGAVGAQAHDGGAPLLIGPVDGQPRHQRLCSSLPPLCHLPAGTRKQRELSTSRV